MTGRTLNPGQLPADQRRARRERHLLALTGGGYRGLFPAEILAAAEEEGRTPLASRFDMMAGTSIGGILAIGLTCGVKARDLADLVREHGPAIFTPRPLSFAGFSKSHYKADGLVRVIKLVLGKHAARPFAEIPGRLIVSAVNERTGTHQLFRTDAAAPSGGDRISTLDVALATSAAPTYFPPHRVGDQVYVDGGLIANAPDLVVLTEALRAFGCSLDECHLLSIGTAGSPRAGAVEGAPGKIGWVARHALVDLIMSAQEALAIDQVRCLRPGTFLRVDATPSQPISLDDVSPQVTERLIALAQSALESTRQARMPEWRRFLVHSA